MSSLLGKDQRALHSDQKNLNEHSKWVEAANLLTENKLVQVPCPSCGLSFLDVEDEPLDTEHINRHLSCPNCEEKVTVLIRIERE
jgi:predicted RNA-binding Zn-ribbon protein involved in translation (DUF1610 family)